MNALQVRHYVQRARDFFECMQMVRDDEQFRNASALLSIHSAISYADALRTSLGDESLYDDDHQSTAKALDKLLKKNEWGDRSGIGILQYLVSMKTPVAYGKQRLDETASRNLNPRAERFATWATNIGKRLSREDWKESYE